MVWHRVCPCRDRLSRRITMDSMALPTVVAIRGTTALPAIPPSMRQYGYRWRIRSHAGNCRLRSPKSTFRRSMSKRKNQSAPAGYVLKAPMSPMSHFAGAAFRLRYHVPVVRTNCAGGPVRSIPNHVLEVCGGSRRIIHPHANGWHNGQRSGGRKVHAIQRNFG